MRLEQFTNDYKQHLASNPNERLINNNGTITIPVVVHVIHNGEALGTGRNISDAQIFSQITTLNQDFNRLNADQSNTPSVFQPIAGNLNFQFVLACTDPNGGVTNGINRIQSTRTIFRIVNDYDSPAKHTNQGGIDAWVTDRYLNIWVCSMSGGEGVATFPSDFQQDPNLDGVMVDYKAFGNIGSAQAPTNKGRTTTHEIGHWLNLIHIWGDDNGACWGTDFCEDTPNQAGQTYGGANIIFGSRDFKSCGNNGDMFMNFMDYADDAYANLFTNDQKIRARAVFQPGGPRSGFIDNYFKLTKLYSDCSLGYYLVRTPFCEAYGNVTWSITGPATIYAGSSSTFNSVYPQAGANGTAVLTASWNNMASDISIPIGYGYENSSYFSSPYWNHKPMTSGSSNVTMLEDWTYGSVTFTGAIGEAKNWRITSNTPQAVINGYGNNFQLFLSEPPALVKVEAEIPTLCGDRTVAYYFTGEYINFSYRISPNPAANQITITASLPVNPNGRTSNSSSREYEVQIFNSFNQLLKKTKSGRGNSEVTIDVSRFPSNQFYTVKLISNTDVQTKSFFKQ